MRTDVKYLIIYPQAGNAFYEVLGRRIAAACEENSRDVRLYPAAAVCRMGEGGLDGATVVMIAPAQCYKGLPDRDRFSSLVSKARKRLIFLAESVETVWFENQFKVPVEFDALIDLGFVSQEEKLDGFGIPYLFLFNSPTREEKKTIERVDLSGRTIPWATVGHDRGGRVKLAEELVRRFDPRGFVFLPPAGVLIRKENGMIGPEGLHALLCKTRYYIWKSLHDFDYYESFRFRESLLAGAMPCKLDDRTDWKSTGIPGIFDSVEAFAKAAEYEGFEGMLNSAREFYFSKGVLHEKLEEVLELA